MPHSAPDFGLRQGNSRPRNRAGDFFALRACRAGISPGRWLPEARSEGNFGRAFVNARFSRAA
jgi:hypothetical protein